MTLFKCLLKSRTQCAFSSVYYVNNRMYSRCLYPLRRNLVVTIEINSFQRDSSRETEFNYGIKKQLFNQCCKFSILSIPASIASSTPVQSMQELLQYVHSNTGLSWWATILMTTIALRLALLPLFVYQHYILAKFENLIPEFKKLSEDLKKETDMAVKLLKWDKKTAKLMFRRSLKKHTTALIVRDNCHPFKSTIVLLLQLPMWISFSFALRNMVNYGFYAKPESQMTYLEMTVGGILWFPNLTVPDESFIIPIMLGIVNLMIIEVNSLKRFQKGTKLQKISTNLFRAVSVAMIPIAMIMPSCISLYWLQSSIFGFGQNLLFQAPKFRRFCKIPITANESQTPFQDLAKNLKLRFKITKSI